MASQHGHEQLPLADLVRAVEQYRSELRSAQTSHELTIARDALGKALADLIGRIRGHLHVEPWEAYFAAQRARSIRSA